MDVNKCQRKPKEQSSKMDNPETHVTLGTRHKTQKTQEK